MTDALLPGLEAFAETDARRAAKAAVAAAVRPDMLRVAPGRHAWVPANGGEPPALAICRWSPDGEGSFRPVPVGGGRWARLDAQLLALLGFRSGSRPGRYATLLRLSRAGFVEMVKVSPGCWLLDLDSWHRHLTACMDDPEMWEPGSEAVRRYNFANGLGGTGLRAPRRSKAAPKAAPKAPKAKAGKAAKSGLV